MTVAGVRVSVVVALESLFLPFERTLSSFAEQDLSNSECLVVVPEGFPNVELPDPKRMRLIESKAQDLSSLWNAGLKSASGEYLMVLDAQHVLAPDALTGLVSSLDGNPKALASYSSFRFVHRYGSELLEPGIVRTSGPFDRNKAFFRDFFPLSTLFRRTVVDRGIRFRLGLVDPAREFWTAALSGEENLAYVGRPLVTRIRAGHEYQDRQSYFKLLSLAQIVSFNPATYSEDLIAWANQAASRPSATLSYVFAVDQPLSAFPLLQKIAKSLARAGEVVTVVGPSEQRMSVKDGIQYLALEGLNSEAIGQYINQLGDQLVLVGVDSVSLLVGFRATPNVVGRVLFDTGSNLIESVDTYSAIDCVVSESSRRSDWLTQGFNLSQVIVNEDSQPDSFSTSLSLFMEPQAQCQEVEYLTALQQMPCFDCGEAGKLHTRALRFAIKRLDVRARQAAVLENLRCLSDYSLAEETADPTMFSIVIPCRNVDILRLRRNLNSLRSQKTFTDLEIVLSDFGSNEKHAALLQQLASEFDCVVARTETRGPWSRSAALNQGIRTATRKWIATTDADMIFSNDFFQMVYCYLSSLGERSIFYAQPIKLPPLDLPLDWQSGDYAEVAAKGRVFGEQGRGGCQIVLRSWLEQVRGFNEAYLVWGNEDDDMFDRAGWAGLNRFWLKPGRYLHQWHMPNIYQAARDENRAQHQALRASPRIVVNDESWGLQKADTEELIKKNPPTSGRSISELQDEIIARAQDTKAQAALLAQHGRQALQNGQLDAALELLEDSVHLSSKDPSVLLSLAETYIKIGQIEFAVVNIDRALELQPSFEPAHRAREVLRTV